MHTERYAKKKTRNTKIISKSYEYLNVFLFYYYNNNNNNKIKRKKKKVKKIPERKRKKKCLHIYFKLFPLQSSCNWHHFSVWCSKVFQFSFQFYTFQLLVIFSYLFFFFVFSFIFLSFFFLFNFIYNIVGYNVPYAVTDANATTITRAYLHVLYEYRFLY